jgi:cellulose biosynthesis protein BcsQ
MYHDMNWQLTALRRFLGEKKTLMEEYQIDYLFLDSSPGIRLWSINAIGMADILFLMMTINDTNIAGTKQMVNDIYESLTRAPLNSRLYLLLNKIPSSMAFQPTSVSTSKVQEWESELAQSIAIPVIGSIPCFCDIQFSRHEFLYAIKQPKHLFSVKMRDIASVIHEAINQA